MTDSTVPAASVPAGWYPVSAGSPELRWWDGTQWTDHRHTIGVTTPQRPTAPAGTSPNTVWIWVFSLLPLAQLFDLPFLATFYARVGAASVRGSAAVAQAELAPNSGLLMLQAISLLLVGVWIVIAVIDYRTLRSRGVDRPFHWAWTFLSPWIYAIGRAVVARRRTGSGTAPLVVFIVTIGIDLIATIVVVATSVSELATTLN